MKSIKEKQFLVNMALALGQTPDPALVKEIDEHNKLMESITVKGDEFSGFLAQLAQLKDEVETVKQVVEVKQQYFEPKEFPKPPSLDELMASLPIEEPVIEQVEPVEEAPVVEVKKENVNPLIAAASCHITKEVQMEANSFQQPEPTDPILRSIEDLKKKIKFLEGWISKISLAGPGGGEVRLLNLDDVDTSALGNNKYLRYNSANAKLEFATVSGGGGGAVESINGQTGEVVLTTANIAEVAPNLYFSDDRALGAFTPGSGSNIAANGLISATITGGGSVDLTAVSTAIIPIADSVQDLGTANLRWGTLYLANNTIDLGGSLISSDGTGTITISSSGAVLPVNSKVAVDGVDKNIALVGNTGAIATVVPFYTKNLGLNTTATNFIFGANPDEYVFTNFTFSNGSTVTQSSRAQFFF